MQPSSESEEVLLVCAARLLDGDTAVDIGDEG